MKLNQWQFIGNLGKDPEKRYSQAGNPILSFTVAVNADKKKGDEWEANTLWARVTCIGERYNWLEERLKKGVPVFVQGKLDMSTYEGREGDTRFSLEVLANDVQVLQRKEGSGTNGHDHWSADTSAPRQPRQPAESAVSGRRPELADGPDDLEDLPF